MTITQTEVEHEWSEAQNAVGDVRDRGRGCTAGIAGGCCVDGERVRRAWLL